MDDVKTQRQIITYHRLNAHHQNSKAQKRIRDLQEKTKIILLHAIHQWPDAVTPHLWPYTLRVQMKLEISHPEHKIA